MTNYATQQQNDDMMSLIAAQFRLLYNPVHAFADAVAMLRMFPGLRGLWTMGQVNGAGQWVDISGNGLSLTNSNVTVDSQTAPLAPKSYFNVADRRLLRTDEAALDLIGNETYVRGGQNFRGMTIGMWIRPDAVSTAQWLMSKWLTTGNQRSYGLLLTNSGANAQFALSTNGTAVVTVTSTVATSVNWMFIAGRFRSEVPDISVFTNGTQTTNSTSIPSTIFNSTANFQIGDNHSTNGGLVGRGSLAFLCHVAVPDIFINTFYQMTAPLFNISI